MDCLYKISPTCLSVRWIGLGTPVTRRLLLANALLRWTSGGVSGLTERLPTLLGVRGKKSDYSSDPDPSWRCAAQLN